MSTTEWFEQATGFTTPSRGISYVYCVDANIVWAAAYDGTAPLTACQEFTKTVNGGELWTPGIINSASGLSLAMIYAIDANTSWAPLYAAEEGTQGIYKTINGGSTWTRQATADFNGDGAFPNCVHFWDMNVGWCMGDPVGGYYEIYTTTDGGTTWTKVPQADIPAPLSGEFAVVGYYDVLGDTIWFGTNMGRVYKSTDKGFHWTVAQTTLSEYIKPTFKDANHGLVIDLNAEATAYLAETSDGGTTWTAVEYTGTCYDNDLCYLPGTDNMYISTGAAESASGASYSFDGGHTWAEYTEMTGTQMMALDFIEGKIGWAGSFNVDETTGGIFKHVPGPSRPIFTINIAGGKGITVDIKNVGDADATDLSYTVNITGGLWVKQRQFTGTKTSLPIGENFSFPEKVMGIGMGFLVKPGPKITVTVTCAEGVTQTKSVDAQIFFSKVTII